MESLFKKINVNTLSENFFKTLKDEWGLLTAGNPESFNSMTVSWGTLGVLWNKPVLICFVRPQRYTFEFMNKSHYYTLSFFNEENKDSLNICGKYTGKETDKIKKAGLTPYTTDLGNVIFEQSRLAFECKKIYTDDFKPENFIDQNIIKATYANNDFHKMYIGEIVNCYKAY
jgi:flavin reductase (DIM6/NTAB) family NADH-FMN oxidoreductase RutF